MLNLRQYKICLGSLILLAGISTVLRVTNSSKEQKMTIVEASKPTYNKIENNQAIENTQSVSLNREQIWKELEASIEAQQKEQAVHKTKEEQDIGEHYAQQTQSSQPKQSNTQDFILQPTEEVTISGGSRVVPETIEDLRVKFEYYGNMFGVDPDILMAMSSQECGGDLHSTGSAKGVAQIEDTVVNSFIQFGKEYFGQTWTENDRYNTNCAIAFMAYTMGTYLQHYDGDYYKAMQAYNFSHYSLDKLIEHYGEDWMENRDQIAYVNGHYSRTGSTSYGDSKYIEHVMRYYKEN